MTSSDLYDDDILWWAEQQAELLRRVAAGECVNDQVVIEEIEERGTHGPAVPVGGIDLDAEATDE
jgi:hypothetical protein